MIYKKTIIYIYSAILPILALLSCEKSFPFQSGIFRPDMIINNYSTTNYKDGKIEWTLSAKTSSYYYDEKRSIAEDIYLNYYKENEAVAVIKAQKAIIYTDSKDIDLIGNVNIKSTTGNRLLTSRIRWNNKDNYLDTDEHVKIFRKNGDIIEGIGLKADYNLEGYEIKRKVIAITKSLGDSFQKRDKE